MDDQLLRRAAVLQAKLKFLEEQKDSFTDREDILAFQRLKKQFDAAVLRHQDELTPNPLATVRLDFENDKTLINKLRQIDAEARLRKVALTTPQSRWLTPEFLANTIEWLPSQKEVFEEQLSIVHARLSHKHWDKDSARLLPDARAIAEILSEDDLLTPDAEEWVATASKKGPHCAAYLGTLAAIGETITRRPICNPCGRTPRTVLLDDLEKSLGQRAVFAFDLAWHQAVDEWQPLFELATSLRKLEIFQPLGKLSPLTEAMLQQRLFYAARDGEIRGPFLLDDLNLLLANRMVSTTELAWHNSIADWQPLSELIRILEEQQSFRLSGFLRFMQWITSGRWMARPSRSDLSRLKDLTSTAPTLSPIPQSPQPFDERTFSLNLPTLTTRRDLEEFFNNQHAPPFVTDDYRSKTITITGYTSDIGRLKELADFFLKSEVLQRDQKEAVASSSVVLRSVGRNKIAVIGVVRQVRPELGLAAAKYFVENLPRTVVERVTETAARQIADKFAHAGATAEAAPCDAHVPPEQARGVAPHKFNSGNRSRHTTTGIGGG